MALKKPKRVDRESYELRSGRQIYGDPQGTSTQKESKGNLPLGKAFYRLGNANNDRYEGDNGDESNEREQWHEARPVKRARSRGVDLITNASGRSKQNAKRGQVNKPDVVGNGVVDKQGESDISTMNLEKISGDFSHSSESYISS